jgi:hypothetical protein
VYAYSKKWGFFTKLWFVKIEWYFSKTWAPLYKYEDSIFHKKSS